MLETFILVSMFGFLLFFMQKKVGIRLRHLQGPPEQPRQQPTYKPEPITIPDQNKKRQRSPSPLNRRKIFTNPYPEQKFQEPTQTIPMTQKPTKRPPPDNSRPPPTMMSPIMNQPLNSNNVSINDGNYEYQSEVERLIESLKKKSFQLERKQELINKLNKQVEYLTVQNREYWQEIKTLKAQLQFERASYSNTQRSQISQNSNLSKISSKQPPPVITRNIKNTYNAQGYEQQKSPIVHVKINPNKPQYRSEQPKPKFNKIVDDRNKEQDSILSDYLSPLMVLNQAKPKSASPAYQGSPERNYASKTSKANSRIQYNQAEQSKEPAFSNNRNNINYSKPQVENPFTKKTDNYSTQRSPLYQQPQTQPQPPDRYLYETAGNFGTLHQHKQRQFDRDYERDRAWPTLQSSAAHFATIPETTHNHQQNRFNSNNRKSKKQLAIDDSKQFRFEDFDFQEFDNSAVHSQF